MTSFMDVFFYSCGNTFKNLKILTYPFFTEKSPPVLNGGGIRSGGKPTSGDGKVIRIINADEQHIKERVLLNLKTSQPFEEVLRDLGKYDFYSVVIQSLSSH